MRAGDNKRHEYSGIKWSQSLEEEEEEEEEKEEEEEEEDGVRISATLVQTSFKEMVRSLLVVLSCVVL